MAVCGISQTKALTKCISFINLFRLEEILNYIFAIEIFLFIYIQFFFLSYD